MVVGNRNVHAQVKRHLNFLCGNAAAQLIIKSRAIFIIFKGVFV